MFISAIGFAVRGKWTTRRGSSRRSISLRAAGSYSTPPKSTTKSFPMTFSALSDHHKGLLLTSVGGLALSVDIPLIRLSSGEVWSILAVRSLMTLFVSVLILVVIRSMGGSLRARLPGWTGVPAGLLYGIGTICFLAAVYYTTAANVVFILAFNPMFAALLSWIFLRERPSPSTLVTMAVMIIGVGLIVSDGMAGGHLIGNILSAVAALSIAGA